MYYPIHKHTKEGMFGYMEKELAEEWQKQNPDKEVYIG